MLGLADNNYRDGTQSFVYDFVSPAIAENYGLTTTEIHEYGHHLNLSHPFDGFDYESETNFGWDGRFYFTGVGNESNSIMSYVDLNWDFPFDRDNTDRFQAAPYIQHANALARRIQNDPNANKRAAQDLAEADKRYGAARRPSPNTITRPPRARRRAAYQHALKAPERPVFQRQQQTVEPPLAGRGIEREPALHRQA